MRYGVAGNIILRGLQIHMSTQARTLIRISMSILSLVAALPTFCPTDGHAGDANLRKKLQKIYDRTSDDPALGPWISDRWVDMIRHGLDLELDKILKADPKAQELMAEVNRQLRDEVENTRIQLLANVALAQAGEDGQYQKLLAMTQDVAEELGFSDRVRKDMHVFVINDNAINAFTYAGLPNEHIDVVVYTGLLDIMSEGELRAVIAHELGHIKARHVANSALLSAIFMATGKNLIPSDKRVLLEENIDKAGRALLSHQKYGGGSSSRSLQSIEEYNLRAYKRLVKALGTTAERIFSPAELKALANRLRSAANGHSSHDHGGLSEYEEASAESDGATPPDPKAIERFKADMKVATASMETTADRISLLATGSIEDCVSADVRLAGGAGANRVAILRQGELLARRLVQNPRLMESGGINAGDHPSTNVRALQYHPFSKTRGYKLASNPVLRALDDYKAAATWINMLDQGIGSDWAPSSRLKNFEVRREMLLEFATTLSKAVIDSIVEEVASPGDQFPNLLSFVDYFKNYMNPPQTGHESNLSPSNSASDAASVMPRSDGSIDILSEISKPGRLIHDLIEAMEKLPQTQSRDAALELIKEISPSQADPMTAARKKLLEAAKKDCEGLATPEPV
jgi:hypothetical protein